MIHRTLHLSRRLSLHVLLGVSLLWAMVALMGCPARTTVRLIGGEARPTRYVSPTAYEHYLRAALHAQRGAHQDALRELRAAMVFDDESPYLHARLAASLIALRRFQPAAAAIRRGLELDGAHPDVLLAAAGLATAQRRFEDATGVLRRCVKGSVLDERCYLRLAALLARRGRPTDARAVLDKLATHTDSAAGLAAHARVCLGTLDLSCAAKKLEQALTRRRSSSWLLQLARVHQAAGSWAPAIKSWREAFDRSGGSLQIARPLLTTLQLANEQKGVDDLLAVLERQVEARGTGSGPLAELMLHARRPARALTLLQKLARHESKDALARARALSALGRTKEAHEALRRSMSGSAAVAAALEAARLHERAGERRAALSRLDRAHGERRRSRDLVRERTRLLIDSGQVATGLALARGAVAVAKGTKRARLALAVALLRAGRWQQAIKEAEGLLTKSPEYVPALNFVGYVLTRQRKEMRRAYQLLEQANRLQPLEAYIVDSMGFWKLRAGHPRQAASLLEVAHRLDPSQSEIAAHLAEAYFALGKKAAALTLFRYAMLRADDARLAARLRARLADLEGRSARKSSP